MLNTPKRQQGATLLVGLILLVLVTLLVVTSFNLGKSNLQIVGNMQHRAENLASAKEVLEEVISNTNFTTAPAAALSSTTCGTTTTNSKCYDVNGDGTADITVTLTPQPCIKKSQIINNSQLDLSKSADLGCMSGNQQNLGVEGAATGDSMCAETTWEITAVAADTVTQASVTAVQGVSVRIAADSASDTTNYCP